MTLKRIALWTGALAVLLPACSLFDRGPPGETVPIQSRDAALVAMGDRCPVADRAPDSPSGGPPRPGAVGPVTTLLVGAAATIAADFAVRMMNDLVEQSGKDLSAVRIASGSGPLRAAAATGQRCLVVVRGPRGPRRAQLAEARMGNMRPGDLGTLGLADYPDFYLELRTREAGGNAVAIEPVFFQFGQTAAVRRGNGTKAIAVTLIARAASARRPAGNAAADEAAFAEGALGATSFSFGTWREGTYFPETTLGIPVETSSASAPFADQARTIRIGSDAAQLPAGDVSLYAFIYESADRGAIERIAAETLTEEGNQKLIRDFLKSFFEGRLRGALPQGARRAVAR